MRNIRLATTKDSNDISDLRVQEFSHSRDFTLLKPERLLWSTMDDANAVIGVWNRQDQAVATLRLVRVNDISSASRVIESELPDSLQFPGLVFNAAATRKDYRRRGFNQLLRYYGIRSAQESGIKSLLSPVYQSAPRITFMKELGYRCHSLPRSWQTKLAPNSPRILCVLEEKYFAPALETICRSIPGLLSDYPWQGPVLEPSAGPFTAP